MGYLIGQALVTVIPSAAGLAMLAVGCSLPDSSRCRMFRQLLLPLLLVHLPV